MKQFNYVIRDPLGLHARPAGLLAKLAKPYAETTITITKGDKSVKASQLMKIMSLAAKNCDEVTVTVYRSGSQKEIPLTVGQAIG